MTDSAGASPEARVREALAPLLERASISSYGAVRSHSTFDYAAASLAPRILAAIRAAARFGYTTESLAPDAPFFDGDDPDLLNAALAALAGEGEGT